MISDTPKYSYLVMAKHSPNTYIMYVVRAQPQYVVFY